MVPEQIAAFEGIERIDKLTEDLAIALVRTQPDSLDLVSLPLP